MLDKLVISMSFIMPVQPMLQAAYTAPEALFLLYMHSFCPIFHPMQNYICFTSQNTEQISMKFMRVIITTNRLDVYILGEIGTGTREQDMR